MLGLTTFSDAFTFALLIVILIVKPTGLFGEKTTDKVIEAAWESSRTGSVIRL